MIMGAKIYSLVGIILLHSLAAHSRGSGGRKHEGPKFIISENTINIDCDVIQADGGTRTASITGGCIALADSIRYGYEQGLFTDHALQHLVASVSVGIVNGEAVLDLDYAEDSSADTDMNVVMTDENKFIEIQGTAEKNAFSADEYKSMMTLAQNGIKEIMEKQKAALEL